MKYRDYLDFLSEGVSLSKAQLIKHGGSRVTLFKNKILNSEKFTLTNGSEVIILNTEENLNNFDELIRKPRSKVLFTTDKGSIKISDILKTSEFGGKTVGGVSINLKPQSFKGLTDIKINANDLTHELVKQLNNRQDLPKGVKNYASKLLLQTASKEDYTGALDGINEIKKDFGEIVGAILLGKSGKFGKNPELFFPKRGNEPVIDYYMFDGDVKHKISAKADGVSGTNTLKLKSVLQNVNIHKYPTLLIDLINIINSNPVIQTPILLYDKLFNTDHSKWSKVNGKIISSLIEIPKDELEYYNDIISSLNKEVKTYAQLYSYTEYFVVARINEKFSQMLTDMFNECIHNINVVYALFDVSSSKPNGEIKLKKGSEDFKMVRLRSKSTANGRYKDSIGVQM